MNVGFFFLGLITEFHKLVFLRESKFDKPRIRRFDFCNESISFTATSVLDSDGEEGQEGREGLCTLPEGGREEQETVSLPVELNFLSCSFEAESFISKFAQHMTSPVFATLDISNSLL